MKQPSTPHSEDHTPGPWRLVLPEEGYHTPLVQRGTEGGFGVHGLSRGRELADARLIAAAPDLLAALEKLISDPACYSDHMQQARVAVKNARGQ